MIEKATQPESGRRRFVNFLMSTSLGATLVAIVYPIIEFLIPPKTPEAAQSNVVVGKISELKPNSGKIFKFGTQPAIVLKTRTGEIRAFSAICTHLNCTVQFREDVENIWCACHNGHYDLNGKNISGPPPRPLEQYTVNVRGDEIIVSKA